MVICEIPVTYRLVPIQSETDGEPAWTPSAKQRAVIALYAQPPWPSYNKTLQTLRVARGTGKGWKRSPAFAELLEAERKQALEQHLEELRTRLVPTSTQAIDVLERAMESDEELGTAVRAAIWTLERTIGKAPEQVKHEGTVRFVLSPGDGNTHAND